MSRSPAALALVALIATPLTLAACGSSNDSGNSNTSTTAASTAQNQSNATVDVGSTKVGDVLTGPNGRTLYLFKKDDGGESYCYNACAKAWPPLISSGKPAAGGGAEASKLGTTKRKNGQTQVTYAGHPLYYYAGDTKAGQATGNGLDQFGAEWYTLDSAGKQVEGSGASKSSGGTGQGSSSGSYSY